MKNAICLLLFTTVLSSNSKGQISLVADINSGAVSSEPASLIAFNDKLYLMAKTAASGFEFFTYDGVSPPVLAEDLNPGSANGAGGGLYGLYATLFNDHLYFSGDNGDDKGFELMKKGATGPAIRAGNEVNTGSASSYPMYITALKEKIYFTANTPATGDELYVYDPATDATSLLADLQPGPSSSAPDYFCVYRDKLYFSATTSASGKELYCYDPATNATSLVQDIYPGSNSSSPYFLQVINEKLYFNASTVTYGRELYSYNGTTVIRLTDLNPGKGDGVDGKAALYKNKIYFSGDNGSSGGQMFYYDPATFTTALTYSFTPSGGYPFEFTVYGGKLYCQAKDAANGYELWETDGTTTKMVQDLYVGTNGSEPYHLTVWKGKMYFAASTAATGTELYQLSTPEGLGLHDIAFEGSVVLAPNPATGDTKLLLNLYETHSLKISVSDLSGKQLFQLPVCQYLSGYHEVVLPINQYAAGSYFYTLCDAAGKMLMSGTINKL